MSATTRAAFCLLFPRLCCKTPVETARPSSLFRRPTMPSPRFASERRNMRPRLFGCIVISASPYERRKGGEHHAHSTLARRRQPIVGRVAGLVAVRPRLRRGGCLDNHRAWVVRHSVCHRRIYHSVLSLGMGRGSPRSSSGGGTLDGRLRVGVGHGKQYGVRHTGDLVWSLGTNDRSRFHHLVARSLASPSHLRRVVA